LEPVEKVLHFGMTITRKKSAKKGSPEKDSMWPGELKLPEAWVPLEAAASPSYVKMVKTVFPPKEIYSKAHLICNPVPLTFTTEGSMKGCKKVDLQITPGGSPCVETT